MGKFNKEISIIFLVPLIVFISVFLFDLKINYLESLILVFGIPGIFLSFKSLIKTKKVFFFSLIVSIPIAFIFEWVGWSDKAWSVPYSILKYRLFDYIPIEDFIWMFLTTYLILIFYETFCSKEFSPKFSKRMKFMVYFLYGLALISILSFSFRMPLIRLPYSFFWFGTAFFLIPVIIFLTNFTKYIISFSYVSLFFLYAHMIFELIGLKLNHWIFPGRHYLGMVSILRLSFPIEELLFVMILGGFAACSYYEFFTNKL